MADVLAMAVTKSLHKLFKVVSCDIFLECSTMTNKVKDFTSLCNFKSNEFLFSLQLAVLHVLTISVGNLFNNIWVVQLCHDFNFILTKFPCVTSIIHLIFEELNSYRFSIFVGHFLTQFHFASCSCTKSFCDSEFYIISFKCFFEIDLFLWIIFVISKEFL